jgi:uncharacterized membrane protein YccC
MRELIARLLEGLLPPDPGQVRLYGAARVTLSGILSALLLLGLERVVQLGQGAMLIGVAAGLYVVAAVRDPTPHGQAVTMLLTAPAGAAAAAVALLLVPIPAIADAGFVALIAAAVYTPAFGPRWPALATLAFFAYLFALLIRPMPSDLPSWWAALAIASASALVARFALLPERREWALRRMERSVRNELAALLGLIEAALRAGAWTEPARDALMHAVDRLNEAAMLAETTATAGAGPAAAERAATESASALRLFALDLAGERAARAAVIDFPVAAARPAIADHLAALRAAIASGGPMPQHPAAAGHLATMLANIETVLSAQRLPGEAAALAATEAGPRPRPGWRGPTLRAAAQAALACGSAIAIGGAVAPNRGYWAAMTAFVLFQGTRSRAESLTRALQSLLGTLAGVLAGMFLAVALDGRPRLMITAIFLAAFFAFHASQADYAMMTFWLTVVLGLVFGLLGAFPPQLLLIRLEEAAIGAVCGAAVAYAVFGTSALAVARQAGRDATVALSAAVDAAAGAIAGRTTAGLIPRGVELHAKVEALRIAVSGGTLGLPASAVLGLRRLVFLLTVCGQWARALIVVALQRPADKAVAETSPLIQIAAGRILSNAAALARVLEGDSPLVPLPAEEMAPPVAAPALSGRDPDAPSTHALILVTRIDAALDHAVQRLVPTE